MDSNMGPPQLPLEEDILKHFPPTRMTDHGPESIVPRDQQVEAIGKIQKAFASGKRAVLLEAPPGAGKSYVTHTCARAARSLGAMTSMLTAQKILQDQYEKDFPSPEVETLKGRNAYPCVYQAAKQGDTCDDAPCTRMGSAILKDCCSQDKFKAVVGLRDADPLDTICLYWRQLIRANRSPITLFNFHSFLAQQRIGRFGVRDLLVTDEAHNVESELKSFIELSIPEKLLQIMQLSFHAGLTTSKAVVDWIKKLDLVKAISDKLEKMEVSDRSWGSLEESVKAGTKELLEALKIRLEIFMAHNDKAEWIVRVEYRGRHRDRVLVAKPIVVKNFGEMLLWSKGRRILATSATILDKTAWCDSVGLPESDVEFIQIGSDFPKENRPIHRVYQGSMSMEERKHTIPKLCQWLKTILLPQFAGQRGIIHTHSFAIAKEIAAGVGSERCLVHQEGQDKNEILDLHASRPDSVIVAPAFHEGVDLKDDLSRFQVIAKIPYPNIGDDVVKARMSMSDGPRWYLWQTALKLVQEYGRSVRSKTDWAHTYVTDDGFETFLQRAWKILPFWFKEALA